MWVCLFATGAQAQSAAIAAGHLVDPAKGSVRANQLILVEDGKIVSVTSGHTALAKVPVIDLSDAYVMPGLIDAHTHMCLTVDPLKDAGHYYFTSLLHTTS